MGILEKAITVCIIGAFVFLIFRISYENNSTVVYDCDNLHRYHYIPERIIDECYKINKPVHIISI